jgi:hypothetical protein
MPRAPHAPETAFLPKSDTRLDPSSVRHEPSIGLEVLTALKAGTRKVGSGLWIAYTASLGNTLSPSHVAIYIRIRNKTDNAIRINAYSGRLENLGRIYELIRIPSDYSHQVLFGFSPMELWKLKPPEGYGSVSFDSNAASPIPPHKEAEGWVLFEYPNDIPEAIAENSIPSVSVSSDYGDHITGHGNEGAFGAVMVHRDGEPMDLSGFHIGWYYRMYGVNRPK